MSIHGIVGIIQGVVGMLTVKTDDMLIHHIVWHADCQNRQHISTN